jgi:hypothetical protein
MYDLAICPENLHVRPACTAHTCGLLSSLTIVVRSLTHTDYPYCYVRSTHVDCTTPHVRPFLLFLPRVASHMQPPPWLKNEKEKKQRNPNARFAKVKILFAEIATPFSLAQVLTHLCQLHNVTMRCVVPPHIASHFIGV